MNNNLLQKHAILVCVSESTRQLDGDEPPYASLSGLSQHISSYIACGLTCRPKAWPNAFTDSVFPVPAGPYGFPPKPMCIPCSIRR